MPVNEDLFNVTEQVCEKKSTFTLVTEYGDVLYFLGGCDYPIATKNGIITKSFEDININQDYLISKRLYVENSYIKLNTFKYNRSSYNHSNRLFVPECVPYIFNEDLAYLCGNIYGDGSEYNSTIELALADDLPDCTDKINNILFRLFGSSIGDYGFNIKPGDGKVSKLVLNKYVTAFLKNTGIIKQKGGQMVFPDIIKYSPKSVVLSFFAGLFDADGYNSLSKKNIDLSLIDYAFLETLKKQLTRCGIITRLSTRRIKPHKPHWNMNYKLSAVGKRSLMELESCGSVKLARGNLYGKYDRLKTPYTLKDINSNKTITTITTAISYGQFISDLLYEELTYNKCDFYIQKIVDKFLTNKL